MAKKKIEIEAVLKDSASSGIKKLAGEIKGIGPIISKFIGPAIILGVAAGFTKMALSVASAADKLGDLSQKIGISTNALQELGYAASLSGSDMGAVTTGLKILSKNMYDASNGNKTLERDFKNLGISITDSSGKLRKAEDVLADSADAMKGLTDETKKVALAQKLFGKSGTELIPMLNLGTQAIKDQRKEAHELGAVYSKELIANSDKLMDNIVRIKTAIKGVITALSSPLIEKFSQWAEGIVKFFKDLIASGAIHMVGLGVSFLAEGFVNLGKGMSTLYAGGTGAGGVISVLKQLARGFAIVAASIKTVLTMIGGLYKEFGLLINRNFKIIATYFKENNFFVDLADLGKQSFSIMVVSVQKMFVQLRQSLLEKLSEMSRDLEIFFAAMNIPKFMMKQMGFVKSPEEVAKRDAYLKDQRDAVARHVQDLNNQISTASDKMKENNLWTMGAGLLDSFKTAGKGVSETWKNVNNQLSEDITEVEKIFNDIVKIQEQAESTVAGAGAGAGVNKALQGEINTLELLMNYNLATIASGERRLAVLTNEEALYERIKTINEEIYKTTLDKLEPETKLDVVLNDEIAKYTHLLDQKLISEEAYLAMMEALHKKYSLDIVDIDGQAAENKKQKLQNNLSQYAEYANQVHGIATQLTNYQSSLVDDEEAKKKENANLNIRGTRAREREIAKIEAEASRKRRAIRKTELGLSFITATANIAEGISRAIAQGGMLGIVTGSLVGIAGAVQLGIISAQIAKAQHGMVIPGQDISGDKRMVSVNSGEAIFNNDQQRRLYDIASGRAQPLGGQGIVLNENIVVQGNLDMAAADKIRADREVQLNALYDNIRELRYRGRLEKAMSY